MKAGPAFQKTRKPGLGFQQNAEADGAGFQAYWWSESRMGNAALTATRDNSVPICSEYMHEMWVKAKILVRGVRQMSL